MDIRANLSQIGRSQELQHPWKARLLNSAYDRSNAVHHTPPASCLVKKWTWNKKNFHYDQHSLSHFHLLLPISPAPFALPVPFQPSPLFVPYHLPTSFFLYLFSYLFVLLPFFSYPAVPYRLRRPSQKKSPGRFRERYKLLSKQMPIFVTLKAENMRPVKAVLGQW